MKQIMWKSTSVTTLLNMHHIDKCDDPPSRKKTELDTRDGYKRSSIDSSWIIERQFVPFPLFLFVSAGHKDL